MTSEFWYFDAFGAAPDVLKRAETKLREPGPGEAVIALRTVGLNQAENRYLTGRHFPPERFPACIGHEAVGEIVALGSEMEGGSYRWSVGDRVALAPMLVDIPGMGALRTTGLYPQSALIPVPEQFSDVQGAAYWMGIFTMAGAFGVAGLNPHTSRGRSVVVTACSGGMGVVGMKLARAWGADCIGTTRSARKARTLAPLAAEVVEVRTPEELASAVSALRPAGVDVVVDPLGGRYVGAAVAALAQGGCYVGYEMIAGNEGAYDIMTMLAKDASIRAHTIFRLAQDAASRARFVEMGVGHAEALTPLVAETFGFEQVPAALSALAHGDHVGKIVVTL